MPFKTHKLYILGIKEYWSISLPRPVPILVRPSSSTEDICPSQRRWSHWTSSSTARGWTTWRSDKHLPSGHSSNQQQCQSGQPKHLTEGQKQEGGSRERRQRQGGDRKREEGKKNKKRNDVKVSLPVFNSDTSYKNDRRLKILLTFTADSLWFNMMLH